MANNLNRQSTALGQKRLNGGGKERFFNKINNMAQANRVAIIHAGVRIRCNNIGAVKMCNQSQRWQIFTQLERRVLNAIARAGRLCIVLMKWAPLTDS
jgi:hypothetical protein